MAKTIPNRDQVITFRPDADMYDAMTDLRDEFGMSFSEQVRRALRTWLIKEHGYKLDAKGKTR